MLVRSIAVETETIVHRCYLGYSGIGLGFLRGLVDLPLLGSSLALVTGTSSLLTFTDGGALVGFIGTSSFFFRGCVIGFFTSGTGHLAVLLHQIFGLFGVGL